MKYIAVVLLLFTTLIYHPQTYSQLKEPVINTWKGIASYYHSKFHGRKTSNGETFSNQKLTCANNFLELGSYIRVKNVKNGKEVIVKVNDRMNPRNKRLIDLSQAAAAKLGLLKQGLGEVSIQLLDQTAGEHLALN
jgi:rare lipoprotein A